MGTQTTEEARERELQLGDRLLSLVQAGPTAATEPASILDATVYTDHYRHASEVAAIAAHPIPVVTSSEIPNAGDFVTVELAGRPIVVTRGVGGQVRALLNVCAHRGATVETRPAGTARVLSCNFHGWSYDLDGSLRAVTDAPLFSSKRCTTGLTPVSCEERHGIVWVTPDPEARTEVATWLGTEVDQILTDVDAAGMVRYAEAEFDLGCNWKLLTDGFLEIYHLKYLHRNSIAPYFPTNTVLNERLGAHFVSWLPKNRLARDLVEQQRDEWEVLDGLTAAIVLSPATVVQWQAGHIELFSLRPHPTDPTRTTARLTMMVPGDRVAETELWARNWERVCETIPGEDFATAVDVQRNINAGVLTELQIGANEHQLIEHLDAITALADRYHLRERADAPRAVAMASPR